jgi:hypothetical protein
MASPEKKNFVINIGIDFGTSFSKVCFSTGKIFNFVKFNGCEYKDSVVYFDYNNNTLFYNKPDSGNNIEEIRYFKYSMIDESLPKGVNLSKLNIKTPEVLCSIFFIACLINESKDYIRQYFSNILNKSTIEWSITMGVPIDNYDDKNKALYDKILHIAYNLSISNGLSEYSINLSSLDKYYKDNANNDIPKYGESPINTLPELYAESLAFLQNRNVPKGVYALMDVGGGTVDFAIMWKEDNSALKFSMVSKDIKPLGIEIVSNNIVNNNDTESIRKYMKECSTLKELPYIIQGKEKEFKENLRRTFAKLVMCLKGSKETESAIRERNGKLPVFICGGGANHKWYEDGILKNRENLRPVLREGLKLEIRPVETLLPRALNINHRLLISYILSQRVEDIHALIGFPWDFEGRNDNAITPDAFDRAWAQEEKMKEIYGEP